MIQILLGSFRPELQPEVTSIVPMLTPQLHFRNAHKKYTKTITRDFNSLAPFLLQVMSRHPKRSTDHGGGRRGCGCRRGGSPRPPEKQQEAVGSELERDPWPPRRVHWRRLWCRIRRCMPVAGAGGHERRVGRDGGAAAARLDSRERVLFPCSDVSFPEGRRDHRRR